MKKNIWNKNNIDRIGVIIFILCIFLIMVFGFKNFAGFQYAPTIDRLILQGLTIIFFLCLLYFAYRFLEWIIAIIKKIFSPAPKVKEQFK